MSSPQENLSTSAKYALCLGALGVVFGDIGTSPLYTMHECVAHLPPGAGMDGMLGILSLIFWSLVLEGDALKVTSYHDADSPAGQDTPVEVQVLEAFMAQYYTSVPAPAALITSHAVSKSLIDALIEQSGNKIHAVHNPREIYFSAFQSSAQIKRHRTRI